MGDLADAPLARPETKDAEAHRLLLRSASVFKDNTPEAWERAAGLALQAIERDSAYARAYASLAVIRMWQGNQHYLPLDSAYDEARRLALQARALDPRIGDPLVVLGWIAMTRERDYAGAEQLFREAEKLTPNDRRIPNYRAILLSRLGRNQDAIAAAHRVTEIDPTFIGAFNNLAAMYGIDGQYQRALEYNRRALEMGPDRPATFMNFAMNFALAGQYDSAFSYGERAVERLPEDPYALGMLGFAYGRGGRAADARAMVDRIEALPNSSFYLRALVHAGLGEADTMFVLLERALAGDEEAIPDLPGDPSFRAYRDDPRMRDLVRRIRGAS
jgi:tetratricopeptide (TPR) repeat protein